MRATQIFKKSEASWEIAKMIGFLFWLPILALVVYSIFWM